jgi:hypothetical protein
MPVFTTTSADIEQEPRKEYVVKSAALPVVVGVNPRTGIDRCRRYRRGQRAPLTAEQAERFLDLGAVFDPDETTADEVEAEDAAATEEQQLTRKQALVKQATELGLEFDEKKTTIPQLEAIIGEELEKRADGPADGTGGPNPDAAK